MGRPKGSKSKSSLDPSNIVESRGFLDENRNSLKAPAKVKHDKGTKRDIRSKSEKFWSSIVGSPLDFLPPSKLPQNKAVIRRYIAMGKELPPKTKQYILVDMLYKEVVNGTWVPARIPTVSVRIGSRTLLINFWD